MIIKNTEGKGLKDLMKSIESLVAKDVLVGVPASANKTIEGGINLATLAAVHEFGATINHGGGTRYQKGAGRNGGARFIKNSFVGPTSGVTSAHTIKIPERSFLRASLFEKSDELSKEVAKGLMEYTKNKKPIDMDFFNNLGLTASSIVKNYMVTASFTPLAASTVRRKGSSKPLIDEGILRQSITYEVRQ